ncbi:MAG TPA: ATP-binding protein [Rhizomicrobium sp.]|nr:ATP-binding protein [Rhizomicrobium sp.]
MKSFAIGKWFVGKERFSKEDWAARQRFFSIQIAKAGLGALLALAFLALVGWPHAAEGAAIVGLMAPAVLAIFAFTDIALEDLESAALAIFAALIGYLAALTGGLNSPLMVWFVLVPAEAALAGGRPAVLRAGIAAGVALVLVTAMQALGALPESRLPLPAWQLYAASILAAVVQAAFVAAAAQDRQRAADKKVAESAQMYRFLADNAMDLITRHAPDGTIRYASPASETLLGVTPEQLIGQAPIALAHPEDLKTLQSVFVRASYFGRAASAEIRLRRGNGSFVWTEIRCRPATRADGKHNMVAITRDISERKAHDLALVEARDMAEAANRSKSRFLANMSHELRTPLNAIIGFSEVMTHEMFGKLGSPRYVEYARLIHESGGHLLELINGVLDMSKIEAGKFEISTETFDFSDVTREALRFVKMPAERKGVTLKAAIAQSASTIVADRRAIKQILINLLSNGIKFTPKGGDVRITAVRFEGGIEIAVADTGVGISQADVTRLGQPFEQVENEHVRAQEGTGLGLALVRALAGMHGGELIIDSTLGEGTIVRVRLPHALSTTAPERGEAVMSAELAATFSTNRSDLRGAA